MAASPATTGKEHCLCERSFLLPSVIEPKFPIGSLCRETSDVVQPRRSIPDGTTRHRARHGQARRQGATRSTATSRIAQLIGIDFIDMM